MGSLFRLPVASVDAPRSCWTAAAAAGRPDRGRDARRGAAGRPPRCPRTPILAVGNERHGVAGFFPRWDLAVRIEQASATESLNAAVAGSILLYVLARRNGPKIACLSRLGGGYPQGLYSAQISRTPLDRERNRRPMRTSELFWKLFATTGSINAYLVYRRLNPTRLQRGVAAEAAIRAPLICRNAWSKDRAFCFVQQRRSG